MSGRHSSNKMRRHDQKGSLQYIDLSEQYYRWRITKVERGEDPRR